MLEDGVLNGQLRVHGTDAADAAGGVLALDSSTNRVGQTSLDGLALL